MSNDKWSSFPIHKYELVILYIYFFTLSIIGLYNSFHIFILSNIPSDINIITLALKGSIFCSLLGCSLSYIRKLYKLHLGNQFRLIKKSDVEFFSTLASFFYFFTRPIYSVTFSFLILLGIKNGLISISTNSIELNSTFCDMTMFVSLFIGFGTGDLLNIIQNKATTLITAKFNDVL